MDAGTGTDAAIPVDAAMDIDASEPCTPIPWTVIPVDDAVPVNDAVLALDPSGDVSFAYLTADREVRHAAGVPGAWEITTVEADVWSDDVPVDLAVDASSRVHVVFRARRGGDPVLAHARREPDGEWTTTDVERLGNDPALVVDAVGVVHVAYVYTSGWQLHYAHRDGDAPWTTSMLDVDDPQRWPALAEDGAGALHLVYMAGGELHYAPAFTDTWAPAVVDTARSSLRTSLAIDGEGGVHLAYHDPSLLPTVIHAYLAPGGEWAHTPIDPGDDAVFLLGDLGLDPGGGAHLVYTRMEPAVGQRSLRYGYRPSGGTWTTEEVFEETPGTTRSLVVDATAGVHLALFGSGGLQYGHMRRCDP